MREVEAAVRQEMAGPGKLLGYRSLHKKIRETHNLNVPRGLVYAMMQEIDPEGLQSRGDVGRPKRLKRDNVFTAQVNYINGLK